jgi:hypothetical protein
MKLLDITESIGSLSGDDTIYAVEPWTCTSEALLAVEPADGGLPIAAAERGMKYFLEVFVARGFLEGLAETLPTAEAKCDRLIQYATNDA